LGYRVYRHPIIMFGIGPVYPFILRYRLPVGHMRGGWQPWLSTMATNVAIAALVATMIWLTGFGTFLLVHLPIMLLAGSIGFGCSMSSTSSRTRFGLMTAPGTRKAALHGSSYYDLPRVLRWFTANFGAHHIHHLCSTTRVA
jgi:omega-6 fatty acid desaturase (delta-12 desaturase)